MASSDKFPELDTMDLSPSHRFVIQLGMKLAWATPGLKSSDIASDLVIFDAGMYEASKFGMALAVFGDFDKAAAWFVEDEDRENIDAPMSGPVTGDMVADLIRYYSVYG